MSETKKYKLEIPEDIKSKDAWIKVWLDNLGATEIKDTLHYSEHPGDKHLRFSDIPKDWLKELPAEPVSAEAWLRSQYPDNYQGGMIKTGGYHDSCMRFAFKAGEQNNELRHRETKSKQAMFDKHVADHDLPEGNSDHTNAKCWFWMGWGDCKESHNID
jgi:hypothetical protein